MIGYWILLLIIAFIAYNFGSISTLSIASVFVFHRDLHRIGKKSMFISNFRRLFGYTGFLKLLLVELIRDFVPILLGGILMSFKEHADIGMAFAGFCLVLGRLFPVYNRFRGSYATICLAATMLCADFSLGIATDPRLRRGHLVLQVSGARRHRRRSHGHSGRGSGRRRPAAHHAARPDGGHRPPEKPPGNPPHLQKEGNADEP